MPWLAFTKDFLMVCVVFALIIKVARLRKEVDSILSKSLRNPEDKVPVSKPPQLQPSLATEE
jgi:hypothetical protein